MTIAAIISAMESFKQLYIDSSTIEVLFIEEITETIQIKYLESGVVTYVTKSSISDEYSNRKIIKVDNVFILRLEGIGCIE